MTGNISSTWTVNTYDQMCKRILFPSPSFTKKVFNDVAQLQERGIHVVDTLESTDFEQLKTAYDNFLKEVNGKSISVHRVPPLDDKSKQYNEVVNFKNIHDKKILFTGLLSRREKPDAPLSIGIKDIARILPLILHKIYNVDLKTLNNPANYFALCRSFRAYWNSCGECNLELTQEQRLDNPRCRHVYQEWGLNGFEQLIETDGDLDEYLKINDPSSEDVYCVVLCKMFGSVIYSDYKLTIQLERVYIPNRELRGEIHKLQVERKVISDGYFDSYKEPTIIY